MLSDAATTQNIAIKKLDSLKQFSATQNYNSLTCCITGHDICPAQFNVIHCLHLYDYFELINDDDDIQ